MEGVIEIDRKKLSLDSSRSGCGPVAVSSEHGNEPSGSIKDREFID